MRVIIYARVGSTRVPNKNWKPFHGEQALFDIKAKQLLQAFKPKDVFVSVETEEKRAAVEKYGFVFLLRPQEWCTPEQEKNLNNLVIGQMPDDQDRDIAEVSVTDPFFNEYVEMRRTWERVKRNYDSLMVVRRCTEQILYADGSPANFDYFGQPTQCLKQWFTISMCCILGRREDALRRNHLIGERPYPFTAKQTAVDVDSADDWERAQLLYAQRFGPAPVVLQETPAMRLMAASVEATPGTEAKSPYRVLSGVTGTRAGRLTE